MNSLDLTPTWAGLLPALFAMLESGTGEGPAIARQELSRLAAWADSHNAAARAAKAEEEAGAAAKAAADRAANLKAARDLRDTLAALGAAALAAFDRMQDSVESSEVASCNDETAELMNAGRADLARLFPSSN